ncbi:MAG: hypothetical protein JSR26_06720 [Proteobacteria bacterium]|nr:hypothetical protein [Pseudomonadota bacterium]
MSSNRVLQAWIAAALFAAFAWNAQAQSMSGDPPDRVARLSYQTGDVEFAASGASSWGYVDINRPLMTGDQLGTGDDGYASLELGRASLRVGPGSAIQLTDLHDDFAQIQLTQGTLGLRVRSMDANDSYEVDTPTIAFVVSEPGNYRIDVAADGTTTVTLRRGSGIAYGEGGVSDSLDPDTAYQFNDPQLNSVDEYDPAAYDAFDRFCAARDARYDRSRSRRYLPPGMIGYEDLDGYGNWSRAPGYGNVWYPQVATGWAPYRDGHWVWVDPWGWTWVDNAPWGFAPSHYGRWAYIGGRWGWIPGPANVQPVYAPALVAFVGGVSISINLGGGGTPVGWFPLGPSDVYVPPYRVSQNYFTQVNVTNVNVVNNTVINNTTINKTVINNTVINNYYNSYAANRPLPQATYVNRTVPGAMTVVPNSVFVGAKPVAAAAVAVKPMQLAAMKVVPAVRIAPVAASIAPASAARSVPLAVRAPSFNRAVIARTAPPPPPVPFAERAKLIASQGGAPLAPAKLRQLGEQQAATRPQAARPVIAAPGGGTFQGAGHGTPAGVTPRAPVGVSANGRAPVIRHLPPAAPQAERPQAQGSPIKGSTGAGHPTRPQEQAERPQAEGTPIKGSTGMGHAVPAPEQPARVQMPAPVARPVIRQPVEPTRPERTQEQAPVVRPVVRQPTEPVRPEQAQEPVRPARPVEHERPAVQPPRVERPAPVQERPVAPRDAATGLSAGNRVPALRPPQEAAKPKPEPAAKDRKPKDEHAESSHDDRR